MESDNSFQKHIDEFCTSVIKSKDFRLNTYRAIQSNRDYIAENYSGHLSEELLSDFITRSYFDYRMREMLPLVVDSVSDDSISNKIFKKLISYKWRNTRDMVIISLCHKKLGEPMLDALCLTNICFECYFEIITKMYSDDLCSPYELSKMLQRFLKSPFAPMKADLLKELKVVSASSIQKADLAEKMLG